MQKISDINDFLKKLSKEHSKDYMNLFVRMMDFWKKRFKKQKKQYLQRIESFPVFKTFLQKADEQELEKLLRLAGKLGKKEATDDFVKDFIRVGQKPKDIYISNDDVIQYAKQRAGWLIKQVDETTKKQVNALVVKGLKESWTLQELKSEIARKFDQFSTHRAALIAHMETALVYGKARFQQALDLQSRSGIKIRKRAKTQQDDKVRPSHRANELAGWIPANQPYPGTGTMYRPHGFFCRCNDIFSPFGPDDNNIEVGQVNYTTRQIQKFEQTIPTFWNLSQDDLQKANVYGLTPQEVLAIKYYTAGGDEYLVNGFLAAETTDQYQAIIPFFYNALKKVPKIEGIFWRGENRFTKRFIDSLKKGVVFSFPSFTGASERKEVAEFFASKGIIFKIISKKGRKIYEFAANPNEKEVMFLPNDLFVVKDIEKKNGITIITIKDLDY